MVCKRVSTRGSIAHFGGQDGKETTGCFANVAIQLTPDDGSDSTEFQVKLCLSRSHLGQEQLTLRIQFTLGFHCNPSSARMFRGRTPEMGR